MAGAALAASVVCCFLGIQAELWTLKTLITLGFWSWFGVGLVLLFLVLSVNGNNAVLLADENGHIQTAAIDINGNGEVDENEIGNVSEANLYINGNSVEVHQPEVQVSAAGDGPEVRVISVENDVDLNGQTVDVAAVTINDQNVIFVDSDQNGEVNVMITDVNGNGEIEQDEMGDVSEHHIAMPTADDVMQPGVTEVSDPMGGDDLPDYSNNADITMYDV